MSALGSIARGLRALYNATLPTYTSGQQGDLQLDDRGRLITTASLASDDALIGATDESAPATDTASSGLNGRLQRVAQRLTSLVALLPAALGQGTMAQGLRVVLPSDQSPLRVNSGTSYETVAASATDQAMGATGAAGDYLAGVLIVPATTSPGVVSIKDGGGGAVTIFTGGADSVLSLVPFFVPLGANSSSGAWKVTTGANVSAIGVGQFT